MSSVSVHALHLGTFSVGLDKRFIRLEEGEPAPKGALRISMNPLLIQNNGQNLLVDCGLGDFGEESHVPYLISKLEEHNLTPDNISDIFLSHLHFDHIGGLASRENGYWELTFPNARIWLSGEEWKKLKTIPKEDIIREQFIDFIEINADLNFVNNRDKPFDGVETRVIGGHTEFSLGLFFRFGDLRMLNAGDVIGTRGHINRKFAAKYDFDGKKSQQNRDELIAMAFDENYIILAYHDTEMPIFRLKAFDEDKGYILENAASEI